jgi:hypothetical protein
MHKGFLPINTQEKLHWLILSHESKIKTVELQYSFGYNILFLFYCKTFLPQIIYAKLFFLNDGKQLKNILQNSLNAMSITFCEKL